MQEQTYNPYSAPTTNSISTSSIPLGRKRTIEEAIINGYDFSIGDVISKAWGRVNGCKLPFFLGILTIAAISATIGIALSFLPEDIAIISNLISNIIINCFNASFIAIALQQLRGKKIKFTRDFFSILGILHILLLASILTTLFTLLGLILFIIPGIYLAVGYYLTTWIIVDNPDISTWRAMEASRKLITQHWFKVFGLVLVLSLIVMLSAIPLGIGLIWTFPLLVLAMGRLYQIIFEE